MELLTLVLVDDEPIILKGLMETYDWEKMGYLVIGFARDGEAALKIIEDKHPDVVLTDVRMKRMDGLQLVERVKSSGWDTDFVIISAYKDFDYAQKACQQGALSYLVKPIEEVELEQTMTAVYKKRVEKKNKEKTYALWERLLLEDRDNFLNQMIKRYLNSGISEEELGYFFISLSREEELEHNFVVVAAGIDLAEQVVHQKEFDMKQYLLDSSLYKVLRDNYQVWAVKTTDDVNCYIVDLGEEESASKVKEIIMSLRMDMNGEMVSALSNTGRGLSGIKEGYKQAHELFLIASEAGAGFLTVKNKEMLKSSGQYSIDIENQMMAAIRRNASVQMKKVYEKFIFNLPENEETSRLYLLRMAVSVETVLQENSDLSDEIIQGFSNFHHMFASVSVLKLIDILYQLFLSVIECRMTSEHTHAEAFFRDDIQSAISYIKNHLDEETLSITEVSDKVFLNSVYFGRMFKHVMKVPFKRYVQNLRIEKAKEMLLDEQESIAEICTRVGIPNPSYFSQLFKQSTGMLPSEYKRSLEQ